MKTIVQSIILLISLVSFSQEKLTGKYCLTYGEGGATCIDFKKNNQFDYVVSGCLGVSALGSGKFELKDENLSLIFDKTAQNIKSTFQISELETQSEKEINLEFEIKDENGFEIPANVIRTSDQKHFIFDEFNRIFIVDKNSTKAKYRVELIGYESLELEIDHNTDKLIHITLFPPQPKIISDKEITIKWNKINHNEFKTGSNSWDKFKKMNK